MSSYRLVFRKRASKEWNRLGHTVRRQFEKKLAERLRNPKVPGDALREYPGAYKIKLRNAGYRLVYRVEDDRLVVLVVAIGSRDGGDIYDVAVERLKEME